MYDPFPIRSSPWLSESIEPWSRRLHLHALPFHIHEIMLSAMLYLALETHISPCLSTWLFGKKYSSLSTSKRKDWDAHAVSFVQSFIIGGLSLWVLLGDGERAGYTWQDRVWGYTGSDGLIQAFVVGYFLWDLSICLRHVELFGLGMLAHAVCALSVYTLTFRPVLSYYSSIFMIYELSNPFMNIHWFLHKLGLTGCKLQLYNGVLLIASFFSCRIVWGGYQSYMVTRDLWRAYNYDKTRESPFAVRFINVQGREGSDSTATMAVAEVLPLWVFLICMTSSFTLNGLNVFWFRKMIVAARDRMAGSEAKPQLQIYAEKADRV